MVEVVTPQMYGAIADGVADDTAAFQRAVDSGYDVYLPTAHRECYRITKTITITKKKCGRIFSDAFYSRSSDAGCILADFTGAAEPRKTYLFDVQVCGITFGGLRVSSESNSNSRIGLFMSAMNPDICDYDIKIERCAIRGFYRVFDFMGRGLEMLNGQVASCNHLAHIYWEDSYDTNDNHPEEYDQRAICIKNCRMHSITNSFITVKSGHAYGLHFVNNTIDNGKGYIARAYDQAWGWNISGNVIQGINTESDALDFRKGMRNCNISNNTFISDIGYWVDTTNTVNSWLKCGETVVGSVINSNVFKNTDNGFMTFKNMENVSIVGNSLYNETTSKQPAITITGTCKLNAIVGNNTTMSKLLSKTLAKTNSVVGNAPTA